MLMLSLLLPRPLCDEPRPRNHRKKTRKLPPANQPIIRTITHLHPRKKVVRKSKRVSKKTHPTTISPISTTRSKIWTNSPMTNSKPIKLPWTSSLSKILWRKGTQVFSMTRGLISRKMGWLLKLIAGMIVQVALWAVKSCLPDPLTTRFQSKMQIHTAILTKN